MSPAKKVRPKKAQTPRPSPKRRATKGLLIRGAEVVTLDESGRIGALDVRIDGGRITEVGHRLRPNGERQFDAAGLVLMPGLVQTHIHLCQTLFRGHADDVELLPWLRDRIWPMEAALGADDLRASADLAILELVLGGTTAILDMGTVRHADALFESALAMGLRYAGGKTIMDEGQGFPLPLRESTEEALAESVRLCERWHGQAGGRLRYAFSPRFALSSSAACMRGCVDEARRRGALLHTHASENAEEVELVRARTGVGNVEYLHQLGFTGRDVVLAHGVWLSAGERRILRDTGTTIAHCPSANLKLASGIARVAEMLDEGISVALGADGAACNNGLDGFWEMRLAALLHKARSGPTAIPAERALRLATQAGARALGIDAGAIVAGKAADLVLVDLENPHTYPPSGDLLSRLVYSARSSDVHSVIIDGQVIVEARSLSTGNRAAILKNAAAASERIMAQLPSLRES